MPINVQFFAGISAVSEPQDSDAREIQEYFFVSSEAAWNEL
jgi:hypothetical protein